MNCRLLLVLESFYTTSVRLPFRSRQVRIGHQCCRCMFHAITGCNTVSVLEHWQRHPKISVRNTWIPWEVCESSFWQIKQPHKHQRRARAVLKNQEASPALLQPERHLLIMPRGQRFMVDLSGLKPVWSSQCYYVLFRGVTACRQCLGTSLDNSSRLAKSQRYMLWSHPLLV